MKKNNLILVIALLVMTTTAFVRAQPILDPTFSNDGFLLTKINVSRDDIARTVLIQPNGKILVGGNSINSIGYSNAGIVRLKANGTYDNTFGTAGISTINGGFFCDMELMQNNKIIVAGSGVSAANKNNYIVYRLKANGSPDSTFGTNGSTSVSMSSGNMICFDVVLQNDGKIVLGGYIDDGFGGHHTLLVVRLNRNGSLDNSFANGGKFTLSINNKGSECHQLAIQPDGKIVAGGFIDTFISFSFFRYDFAAVRLQPNGTLDPMFANAGVFRSDIALKDDDSYATVLLSDGRIVLGGFSEYPGNTQFAALCLLPNGTPDNSFGTGGWKYINFNGATSFCNSMAVENDDDIILAGDVIFPGGSKAVALAKIQNNGSLDPTFGTGGIDTSFFTLNGEGCNDVVLQADNKIVMAGYKYTSNHYSFLTARYINTALRLVPDVTGNDISTLTAYPNPVKNSSIIIQYSLSAASYVTIDLFGVNEKLMDTWYEGLQPVGNHEVTLSLPDLTAGTYIVRLNTESGTQTFKIQKTE